MSDWQQEGEDQTGQSGGMEGGQEDQPGQGGGLEESGGTAETGGGMDEGEQAS
jgi:hypothetical protein